MRIHAQILLSNIGGSPPIDMLPSSFAPVTRGRTREQAPGALAHELADLFEPPLSTIVDLVTLDRERELEETLDLGCALLEELVLRDLLVAAEDFDREVEVDVVCKAGT